MFDSTHPWFRPLWLRVVLLLITAGWGLFELAAGSVGWAFVFLAMAGWVIWALFITYDPDASVDPKTHKKDGDR